MVFFGAMRRLIPALVLACLLLPACASPKEDFAKICEITTRTRAEKLEPAEEAQVIARRISKAIKTEAARNAMKALASAPADQRYSMLQTAAREAGVPGWSCPAIEDLLHPGPKPAP